MRSLRFLVFVTALATGLGACSSMPGPSDAYPASSDQVRDEIKRMEKHPVGLERPLVILDGWVQTGGGQTIRDEMIDLTGAPKEMVLLQTFGPGGTPEGNVRNTIRSVEKKWPSDDPCIPSRTAGAASCSVWSMFAANS